MTSFAVRIRPIVQRELDASSREESRGHFTTAFRHLERAHVLGQAATREHVRVHWAMLRYAMRHGQTADAFGQVWRLIGAALLTAIGLVPTGNTGGSDVSGFRRMPIEPGIASALAEARRRVTVPRDAAYRVPTFIASIAALLIAACGTPPADVDLSLAHPSAGGAYRVALIPPTKAPTINELHTWTVRLTSADGAPVHGATFTVDGGMPQHGHGLPTKPRVTGELGDGDYRLEGMKFSMTRWWQVKLAIDGPLGADQVTFNTVVGQPPVQR